MKSTTAIRMTSFLVALAFMFMVLAGCGTTTTTAGTTAGTTSGTTSGTTAETTATQRDTSPVTLTAFMNSPGEFKGMDETEVSKEVLKRTGVTLDIRFATTDDSQELNTLIASNDLPDLLRYDTGSAVRTTLWTQGYLSPLNDLMDEFAPSMWDIMPTDFDVYWSESDGNMYVFPSYYSDEVALKKITGNNKVGGGFVMHKETYEALGKPSITTLEDYKNLLIQVKEQYPDKFNFVTFDGRTEDPMSNENALQLINRMYGGTNPKAVADDGTVHFNFKDESYKKAVLYINDLYRAGLFNPENYTVNLDQFNEYGKNQKIFSYWGQAIYLMQLDMENEETRPYHVYEFPKEPGVTPKMYDALSGIGFGGGVSISANSKNKARAIQYMEFLLSEEGQMLTYHGIEGPHYTMVDGYPKNTEYKNKAWANWTDMINVLGIMGSLNWMPLMETDAKYYYWLNSAKPAYKELMDTVDKYANFEKLSVLATVKSDSEEKVIENKIIELWKNAIPKMTLAKTQAECEAAYNAFISDANALGVDKLEAGYSTEVKKWKAKMN